jgi:hypothetical protein
MTILSAAGAACVLTYFAMSAQKDGQLKTANGSWIAERAQLKAEIETKFETTQTTAASAATTPATDRKSPQDIINDLLNLKLDSGDDRAAALRQVIFKLETLAQRGASAVPPIRAFLMRNVDREYSENNTTNNNPFAQFGGQNNFNNFGSGGALQNLQMDWVAPPSLRLGLLGVLNEIGGADSEKALAETFSDTPRGVEVAYLAHILEKTDSGKHRDAAIAAAKRLLLNPPSVDKPDRFDQLSKSYLYGVLEMFQDTSFATNAQQMLVGADGRLDQNALNYLSGVLKEQSVPALCSAYENPGLTNQFDKMTVARAVFNYTGQNQQADNLFQSLVTSANLDARIRAFSVIQLAGGTFGPFSNTSPTDPKIINGRIQLLTSLQGQTNENSTIRQTITMTIGNLHHLLKKEPLDNPMPALFGGGRGGRNAGFGGGTNGSR